MASIVGAGVPRMCFFLLLAYSSARAETAALNGIKWLSNPQPRRGLMGGLGGPVISSYYAMPCASGGIQESICPGMRDSGEPWDENTSKGGGPGIPIVGYDVTLILSSQSVQGVMEVGQAGGNNADIFGVTAGVGANNRSEFFPTGTGIVNGPKLHVNSHFDVYVASDGNGTFQALVNIYYTSP